MRTIFASVCLGAVSQAHVMVLLRNQSVGTQRSEDQLVTKLADQMFSQAFAAENDASGGLDGELDTIPEVSRLNRTLMSAMESGSVDDAQRLKMKLDELTEQLNKRATTASLLLQAKARYDFNEWKRLQAEYDEVSQNIGNNSRNSEVYQELVRKYTQLPIYDAKHVASDKDPSHMKWVQRKLPARRSIESVFMDPQLKHKMLSDISTFLSESTKRFYAEHGIPYTRTLLLHGPPGTGKTSTCEALACEFDLPIYVISNEYWMDDASLLNSILKIPPRSMVLFEDVDSMLSQEDQAFLLSSVPSFQMRKMTYKGLINALDGVGMQQSGLIFVLTTNHRQALPSSLKRAGRIDCEYRMAAMHDVVASLMFASFVPTATEEQRIQFAYMAREAGVLSSASTLQSFFLSQRAVLESPAVVLQNAPAALVTAKSHGALDIADFKDSFDSSFGNNLRCGPLILGFMKILLMMLPLAIVVLPVLFKGPKPV